MAVASVAAFPLVEAIRIVVQSSPTVFYGDEALIDLATRRAAHFGQLVGPYSRDGFFHPGPAVFYLLAPFEALLHNGPGIYLGAIAISGASLIAAVWVLWRRHGVATALWAAMAINVYCLCVLVGTLREPWNPYLVLAPMVLFAVLWAEGMAGSTTAALWALVVGSYAIQTLISTAGFVVVASVVVVVRLVGSRWRPRPSGPTGPLMPHRRTRWSVGRGTGAAALVIIWLPPIIELWHDHPNNVRLVVNFFSAHHARPPLHQTLSTTVGTLTIVPFGNRDYTLALSRPAAESAGGIILLLVAFVVAVVISRRRHVPAAMALTSIGAVAAVVGGVSPGVAPAPLNLYFAEWLAFVPVCFLLAIGVALLHRPATSGAALPHPVALGGGTAGGTNGTTAVALALAAILAATLAVRSDVRMGPVASTTVTAGPWARGLAATAATRARAPRETRVLVGAAEHVLGPRDRTVALTIGTGELWPYAAGVVDALDKRGVTTIVRPASSATYFGPQPRPASPPSVTFDLYESHDASARPAGTTPVASVDGDVLTMRRA